MDLFQTQIGNYKIESHLGKKKKQNKKIKQNKPKKKGRGAFGVVYKCSNIKTN
jgi:hypothetical protein